MTPGTGRESRLAFVGPPVLLASWVVERLIGANPGPIGLVMPP